jgi:hypothetical protein
VRRLTLFVVLVAFLFSCGGQWPVLQVVAWANMIREYSQMVPLATAVQMTFSGHYPCALCKALAQKNQSEDNNKIAALVSHEKKLLPAALVMSVPETDNSPLVFRTAQPRLETRSDSPPTPPPRLA